MRYLREGMFEDHRLRVDAPVQHVEEEETQRKADSCALVQPVGGDAAAAKVYARVHRLAEAHVARLRLADGVDFVAGRGGGVR